MCPAGGASDRWPENRRSRGLPRAKGALPDTESGVGWGVNWVVRSPEAMGGKPPDGLATCHLQQDQDSGAQAAAPA